MTTSPSNKELASNSLRRCSSKLFASVLVTGFLLSTGYVSARTPFANSDNNSAVNDPLDREAKALLFAEPVEDEGDRYRGEAQPISDTAPLSLTTPPARDSGRKRSD